jgi:hypothetical protein
VQGDIDHLFADIVRRSLRTHLPDGWFKMFGDAYQPLLFGAAMLAVFWLILFWMWRRKIFLRI